jgi:hypothetical protein
MPEAGNPTTEFSSKNPELFRKRTELFAKGPGGADEPVQVVLGDVSGRLNPERAWITEGRNHSNIMLIEKKSRGEVAEITLPGKHPQRVVPGIRMVLQLEADHQSVAADFPDFVGVY